MKKKQIRNQTSMQDQLKNAVQMDPVYERETAELDNMSSQDDKRLTERINRIGEINTAFWDREDVIEDEFQQWVWGVTSALLVEFFPNHIYHFDGNEDQVQIVVTQRILAWFGSY